VSCHVLWYRQTQSFISTPLYQILRYALPDKDNRTKFKLIYANVSENDILLREKFDELKSKYPDTFDVTYVLEKADKNWKGAPVATARHNIR
jgi:cytochrome-b5 reductase